MAAAAASADWDTLGDSSNAFYRRVIQYGSTESWSAALPAGVDLADYVVASADNGGPIALTRDDSKPVIVGSGSSATTSESGGGRKKRVWLYTCSGVLLRSIVWDYNSRIIKLGFTSFESLVILAKDGTYRIYPLNGPSPSSVLANSSVALNTYTQHSLTADLNDAHILDARIYPDGAVILSSALQFLEIRGWPESPTASNLFSAPSASRPHNADDLGSPVQKYRSSLDNAPRSGAAFASSARIDRFVESGLEQMPNAWCLLKPEQSTSRQAEVLMSVGESLRSIDQLDVQDQRFSRGPFSHIVPSPSGRFFAFLTARAPQSLLVVSSDFAETLSQYDLSQEPGDNGPPRHVLWCGSDSVVLAWTTSVTIVGPYGRNLRYYYNEPIHLTAELDGLRILSATKCEFLHKVAPSTAAVFQPGSAHSAAILFEAQEEFASKSARAHERIAQIRSDLAEAVDTCIDAAGREFDVTWQRKLLKAAAFGKTFLDLYNPADFVAMSRTLRVLNACRHYEIGIPITYEQYMSMAPAVLVSRLVLRHHHLLALRISSFLGISPSPTLRHWASVKVSDSKNDNDDAARVSALIVGRLSETATQGSGSLSIEAGITSTDISCADVARIAWSEGKTILATRLLEHEPRAHKQVHLLLAMKEDNLALLKATRSGDSDLVLTVLLSLRKQHSLGNFFRLLDGKDEAIAILLNYGKRYDTELVRDFWFQEDRRMEAACFALDTAAFVGLRQPSATEVAASEPVPLSGPLRRDVPTLNAEQFGKTMELVRTAAKLFSEDRDCAFESKICDDRVKLMAFQQSLQSEAGPNVLTPFVGLSVNETIRQCFVHNWAKKAEKLRTDFKISDKRWWYVKMKGLIEIRDWEGLEQFARSRKSPIGYDPFVEHLLSTGNTRQALQYIPKCEPRNRADLYISAGDWVKAGEEHRDRGERGKLQDLIGRSPNSHLADQLTAMLDDIRGF